MEKGGEQSDFPGCYEPPSMRKKNKTQGQFVLGWHNLDNPALPADTDLLRSEPTAAPGTAQLQGCGQHWVNVLGLS